MRNLAREADVRAMLQEGGADAGDRLSFVAADLERTPAGPRRSPAAITCCTSPRRFPRAIPKDEDELIVPARDGALRVLRAARDAGVSAWC